jgi:hypothetical protein
MTDGRAPTRELPNARLVDEICVDVAAVVFPRSGVRALDNRSKTPRDFGSPTASRASA